MRFFGEWATVSSLVCFDNLFIFLSISIDTENHPSIPYFHPTHRGRFKHQCSEVPNTNLVCCRCTFDLRGEAASFCSQSIYVGVYVAVKGLSCVIWGQFCCLGFWGGCLLTVLQHTPGEPRFWDKNRQSNWLICRGTLTPALVQLAQWVHEHGEVSESSKKPLWIWCYFFRLHLCRLFLLFYGSGSSIWATSLQVSTTHLLNWGWDKKTLWCCNNLGWWCLNVGFNSSPAKKKEIEQLKNQPWHFRAGPGSCPLVPMEGPGSTAQQRTCAGCGNDVKMFKPTRPVSIYFIILPLNRPLERLLPLVMTLTPLGHVLLHGKRHRGFSSRLSSCSFIATLFLTFVLCSFQVCCMFCPFFPLYLKYFNGCSPPPPLVFFFNFKIYLLPICCLFVLWNFPN